MKVSAEDVLRLLIRVAQQFLSLSWQLLGEKKEIVNKKD